MYQNKYEIGRSVKLVPPPAKIVGVEFRQVGNNEGGVIVKPFYSILAQGQVVGGVPEVDILGIDKEAEQREREEGAAKAQFVHDPVRSITGLEDDKCDVPADAVAGHRLANAIENGLSELNRANSQRLRDDMREAASVQARAEYANDKLIEGGDGKAYAGGTVVDAGYGAGIAVDADQASEGSSSYGGSISGAARAGSAD